MKEGVDRNLSISGVERFLLDIYLMFLFREIDIKLCQIFTKIHKYAILYKNCNIKQIKFNKYAINLKTAISHSSLRISGLLVTWFPSVSCDNDNATAIDWSSGDVIRTIRAICNYIINHIYILEMQNKTKIIIGANLRFRKGVGMRNLYIIHTNSGLGRELV